MIFPGVGEFRLRWDRSAGIALALMLMAGALGARGSMTDDRQDGLGARSLDLVNAERRAQGLAPLTPDPRLDAAAQRHARDMLRQDYFSHVSPDGSEVVDRVRRAGGDWPIVGENIAVCTGCSGSPDGSDVERFHQGWMTSPEHRANILDRGYSHYGFALAVDEEGPQNDRGTQMAVQTFGGPGVSRGDDAGPVLSRAEQQQAALDIVNARRRDRGLAALGGNDALRTAAAAPLDGGLRSIRPQAVLNALPASAGPGWRRVQVLIAECSGCGTRPHRGDVEAFIDQWLGGSGAAALLDRSAEQLGFALAADGQGHKVAVAAIGLTD